MEKFKCKISEAVQHREKFTVPARATADEAESPVQYFTPEPGWINRAHRQLLLDLARQARKRWLEAPAWVKEQVMNDEAARAEKDMTPAEHRAQCISFAYGNVHLANPNVTREMVEAAYDELHPDEAEKEPVTVQYRCPWCGDTMATAGGQHNHDGLWWEFVPEPLATPPACWTLEPQGVDVEKLRKEAQRRIDDTPNVAKHLGWGEFGYDGPNPYELIALLNELEQKDKFWSAIVADLRRRLERWEEISEARIADLEQRLRVVADGDMAVAYGALKAQTESYAAEFTQLRARITELERILAAERAEYDWAVKGAKALEAKVERVREWSEEGHCPVLKCGPEVRTILNGGTDGTE